MKRIAVLVPFMLLLVAVASVLSPAAHAAGGPPPINGFHIENQMLHCVNRYLPCNTPQTAANSLYTNVEVDKFAKKSYGKPDLVNLVCGYAYLDTKNNLHLVAERATVFDPRNISGYAELEGNYSQNSTYSIGEIKNVVAYDAMTGDTARVSGRIVTNNAKGTRIAGGFDLTLTGPIYDEVGDPGANPQVTKVGYGTFNCNSYTSYVKAPFATGPYFIASLGAPPGP